MDRHKFLRENKSKVFFFSLSVVFVALVLSLAYFIKVFSGSLSHIAQSCEEFAQACFQAASPYGTIFDSPIKILALTFLTFAVYAAVKLALSMIVLLFRETKCASKVRSKRVKNILKERRIHDIKVQVFIDEKPVAYTYGIMRPKVCLSTKMIDMLDDKELEAVLLHEAAHVYKRDNIWVLLITFIKDSLTFIPVSGLIYKLFRREKEYEADDFALLRDADSLGLASAIIKISKFKSNVRVPYGALAFSETKVIEDRVKRLLNGSHRPSLYPKKIAISLVLSIVILFSLVAFGYALPKNSGAGNGCGMTSGCSSMSAQDCST